MNIRIVLLCLSLGLAAAGCAQPEQPLMSIDPDGRLVDGAPESRMIEARVLGELTLANGNTVTFFRHADGGMVVREHGEPRTNAIGAIPQLAAASPYEIFVAIAPPGAQVPAELVADQANVVAARRQRGEASTVPDGFRVDGNPAFYARNLERAFNSCTDVSGWEDSVGSSPIGANCPASGAFAFNQCVSNWLPPHVDSCAGTSCTEYFLSGYHQSRSSVCARAGDGLVNFAMGIRDHGGSFQTWFDHQLSTGGYYYYWYSHTSQEKDFWRLIYRTDDRRANKSWWLVN